MNGSGWIGLHRHHVSCQCLLMEDWFEWLRAREGGRRTYGCEDCVIMLFVSTEVIVALVDIFDTGFALKQSSTALLCRKIRGFLGDKGFVVILLRSLCCFQWFWADA